MLTISLLKVGQTYLRVRELAVAQVALFCCDKRPQHLVSRVRYQSEQSLTEGGATAKVGSE